MTQSLTSAHEWRISTRARGEVLTAAARSEGCHFLVFGAPGEHTAPEIEAWLGDLLGVAAEGTRNDERPRPIPALLHHALTGLLFSHREVWNSVPPSSTISLAFVQSGDDVAFGWVGECEPRVWVEDRPADAPWVRVRDHEGREAYALSVKAGLRVRVILEWTPSTSAPDPPGVQVDAEWVGGELLAPGDGEAVPEAAPFTIADMMAWDPTRAEEAGMPAPFQGEAGASSGRPPEGAAPLEAQAGSVFSQALESEPGLPELIPPTPEPPDLTARALQSQAATRARAVAARPLAPVEEPAPTPAEEPAFTPAEEPAPAPRPRPRPRMRPAWPSERELHRSRPRGVRPWMWLVGVAALVGAAWILGLIPGVGRPGARGQGLAFLGLGGARFQVNVESRPAGAWIAADGKDLAQRTPAAIELAAGEHEITLSFPDLGSAAFAVRGARGDRQVLSAALWGSIAVREADANVPIAVNLDGAPLGYAPLTIDSLAPGAHELRFSGPGLTPWGQALSVRVGEATEVIARPMTAPSVGMLEVRSTYTDGNGTNDLAGASVWVDGDYRGATPVVLELPRGPHSVRVEHRGERAPIQVIDLPGGNQRFASFELGLNVELPTLEPAALTAAVPLGRPTVVSASLDGVGSGDLREMWLHVREPDGLWRRYQMMMLKAPGGVVGVALFPVALFDARGTTRYYMSAATQTGDEYFTEIFTARAGSRQASAR